MYAPPRSCLASTIAGHVRCGVEWYPGNGGDKTMRSLTYGPELQLPCFIKMLVARCALVLRRWLFHQDL